MKQFFLNRLGEGSTWHGLFWVMAAFGIYQFDANQAMALTAFLTAIFGGTAVVVPDSVFKKVTSKFQ